MIRININESQMKKIEENHWKWFKQTGYNKLEKYIEEKQYIIIIDNKKELKFIPEDIYKFLEYLKEDERVKSILIGGFLDDEANVTIDKILEEIKIKFPYVLEFSIKNSIIELLKKTRETLSEAKTKNEIEKIEEVELAKKEMREYIINIKNEIENKYNYNEILNFIENIKIAGNGIKNLPKLETIFTTKTIEEEELSKALKFILEDIFNYDSFKRGCEFENEESRWGAYELLLKLGITTCPYCNRQYIHTYIGKDGKARADIDHFYPKSKYPFLAVSLYNFIPSCHTCNSSFKGSIDFYQNKCIYPYKEDFGQATKFKTKFYDDTDNEIEENERYDIRYLLGNSDNFKIEIKAEHPESDTKDKIENSINTFHIEDLYNFHKDYVRELIKKAIIYNESRIDELYTQYPELFRSRDEVLQMVVSNYIDHDLGRRPLSKLTKDICEELGLK